MRFILSFTAVAIFLSLLAATSAQSCDPHDGLRQSPIGINSTSVIRKTSPHLKWSFISKGLTSPTLTNNGHTLQLRINTRKPFRLSGGLLDVEYDFVQLHFHWGDSDNQGAEHTINGKTYPLEMHLVHSQTSSNKSDMLVVVGYLFNKSPIGNKALDNLLKVAVDAAANKGVPQKVASFPLPRLINNRITSYYTYEGSLTTHPYNETVTWILVESELSVSEEQLNIFRLAAKRDAGLVNNFRCIQDVKDRKIYYVDCV